MAHTTDLRDTYAHKLSNNRWGLWLFIFSDAAVFIGLFITRFILLPGQRPELDQTLGLIITAMLLVSSYFMYRAEVHMRHGNIEAFQSSILTTLILGVIFLLGVVAVEWQIAHFGPADGQEGAIFYVMTGFHAFHVLTGVILLWWVYNNSKRGVYTSQQHWGVEAAAVYWHFIDVVWIFFYPALYLIGTVA